MFDGIRRALERRLEHLTGQSLAQVVEQKPNPKLAALKAAGNAKIAANDMVEAETYFRLAFGEDPNDSQVLVCLAYALKEQARSQEARVYLRRALAHSAEAPDAFEWHYLLGEISEQEGAMEQAALSYAESLRLKPDFSRACRELSRMYEGLGQKHAVKPLLLKCIAQCPDCQDYRLWLASVYEGELDFKGVVDQLLVAISLGTQPLDIWTTLGAAYFRTHQAADALRVFDTAEAMDSKVRWMRHYHAGYFHVRNGHMKDAIAELSQALELNPLCLDAHSLLIMVLSSAGDEKGLAYRAAAMRFADVVTAQNPKPSASPAARVIDGPLRVGFYSSDFRMHPVYHFLKDLLPHFDRSRFQLFAFSNNAVDDEATQHLQSLFDQWHGISTLNDAAAADLVQASAIDILIDLGGHTSNCRLSIFARKPAAVQVSWLGYFASTGLSEIDFILADDVSVPLDSHEWFSERVYRLPRTRLCMSVPHTKKPIAVGQLPYLKHAYITFGCFQQAAKITVKVLSVWKQILQAIPDARLRIQGEGLGNFVGQNRVVSEMQALNFDLSRVDLLAPEDFEHYLSAHNEIDILLDTFPYPGGTTTALALWMGLPTITLTGGTMLARQGEMMMRCVGLNDWIAHSEREYVEIAIKKSIDIEGLTSLRRELRTRAIASPLFASKQFATEMQDALRSMYEEVMTHK